jgi:hypothetical protein
MNLESAIQPRDCSLTTFKHETKQQFQAHNDCFPAADDI